MGHRRAGGKEGGGIGYLIRVELSQHSSRDKNDVSFKISKTEPRLAQTQLWFG